MKGEERIHKQRLDEDTLKDFGLERYRYILQQLTSLNDNVHKFLALYQTLATAIVGGALALFIGYSGWRVSPLVAKAGVVFLLSLETIVAAFTILLIVIGILSWIDYRREEVSLTEKIVHSGFRQVPNVRNMWRWYEIYVIGFIGISTVLMWIGAIFLVLPNIK